MSLEGASRTAPTVIALVGLAFAPYAMVDGASVGMLTSLREVSVMLASLIGDFPERALFPFVARRGGTGFDRGRQPSAAIKSAMMDPFLDSRAPLVPGAATAAILLIEGGYYLLQHRDAIPGIFFPDHWGFFGGATEPGESDEQGLRRELQEELTVDFSENDFRYFTRFNFDFNFCGRGKIRRIFFEIGPLPLSILDRIVLGEGRAAKAFTAREALGTLRLTPYDNFALWMHANRARMQT